ALAPHRPGALRVEVVPRRVGPPAAYVLASWGTPRWLVNAHFDTVPAVDGWSSPPLALQEHGSRLVGLGAADVKGAIAALLTALSRGAPRDCAILLSGDEEKDSTAMRHFLAHACPPSLTDAIVCEPTGGRVGVRHRGIVVLEAACNGPGGHSSQADHLAAPLAELCAGAAAVSQWAAHRRALGPPGFPGLCLNVAGLSGGVDYNIVPHACRLTLSMRPPPGEDAEALADEACGQLLRAAPRAEVRRLLSQASFATRDPARLLERLGLPTSACLDLPFWTEGALLAAHDINTVVYGPGEIAYAHLADESIELSELRAAVDVFAHAFSSP
ncbi:MAG TPA: M20/M25/M40 family metallo-hydrolase, partial [Myxococcota bacterium]|nr:M20/M25/M40 family metallo-hydrolase [Myxococcota bacterium]